MEIQHTANCLAAREKERAQLAAYETAWPSYCRKCGGEGGHTDYEYRGECHGMPASEQVFENCPDCIENNQCPRCGSAKNNFVDSMPLGEKPSCWECGWNADCPDAPEVVNDLECGCFDFMGEPAVDDYTEPDARHNTSRGVSTQAYSFAKLFRGEEPRCN